MIYANEWDKDAAKWLGQLFPDMRIDNRSIKDAEDSDLVGYDRVHLFAGIGGWELACELAGWPSAWLLWTGSCPCQPFSQAGKRQGAADERHLWPEMFRLVRGGCPPVVCGEQVSGKDGLAWLDGVFADLESIGYACWACDLPAACVDTPHKRQRLWWAAFRLADVDGRGRRVEPQPNGEEERERDVQRRVDADGGRRTSSMGTAEVRRTGLDVGELRGAQHENSPWGSFRVIYCQDGSRRRVGCSVFPLAHGVPAGRRDPRMGRVLARLRELGIDSNGARRALRRARANRGIRLRGYGNAIVPQMAAVFLGVVMDVIEEFGIL